MHADVWHVGQHHVDIYIPPGSGNAFPDAFEYVDSHIPAQLLRPPALSYWNLSSLSNTTFHDAYHRLEDIHTFTRELLDLYPDNVKLVPIGHTAENREIYAIEIFKDERARTKKPGFVITGAQHAREVCPGAVGIFQYC